MDENKEYVDEALEKAPKAKFAFLAVDAFQQIAVGTFVGSSMAKSFPVPEEMGRGRSVLYSVGRYLTSSVISSMISSEIRKKQYDTVASTLKQREKMEEKNAGE